jgi:hypothetical protein
MEITEKNRQIWHDLYATAASFRDMKAWDWMYDSDLFGVQVPSDGEIAYCCVLGNLGDHFGLNAYLGVDGLYSYYEMLEFGEDDPMMAGLRQHCLALSFENEEDLTDQDKKVIDSLGLSYQGNHQWVMLREFSPGMLPWYMNDEQALFLTTVLQQAIQLAQRTRENADLLLFDEEKVLVRVLHSAEQTPIWQDQIMDMPDIRNISLAIPPDVTLMRELRTLPKADEVILLNLSFAPSPVTETDEANDRPFFPVIALMPDKQSGAVRAYEMFKPGEVEHRLQQWLSDLLKNELGYRPRGIVLSNGYAAGLLEAIAEELEIDLYVNPDEPVFHEVMEMMFQFLN